MMRPRRGARVRRVLGLILVAGEVAGCSLDGLFKQDEVPPGISDPKILETHDGAMAVYYGTLAMFRAAFAGGHDAVSSMASLSDELHAHGPIGNLDPADMRILPDTIREGFGSLGAFDQLQEVRAQAGQAVGLLNLYAPEARALLGHTYALKGYSEILLAELFCSGIPLTTLDFRGNITYQPGWTTASVLGHALALFDTASTLAGDSDRFVSLASMGRARALLGMGQFAAAAAAVAGVPDNYRYEVSYTAALAVSGIGASSDNAFVINDFTTNIWHSTVGDREGGNGIDYISSGDPRSATIRQEYYSDVAYFPAKYAQDGSSPVVLADGVEARLIEAEAALHAKDYPLWLAKLNQPRRTAWSTIVPAISEPLPDLTDPGASLSNPADADSVRVDLLFRERAFWLFLTGHRQGDLRRLIRQYGRREENVYPAGQYPYRPDTGLPLEYGHDVAIPVPNSERILNPLFTGCITREA